MKPLKLGSVLISWLGGRFLPDELLLAPFCQGTPVLLQPC